MKVTLRKAVERHIRANARRGARQLDAISKDWFRQSNISLTRLDLSDGCNCVWGQLENGPISDLPGFEPYGDANIQHIYARAGFLPGFTGDPGSLHNRPPASGDGSDHVKEAEWAVLQDEWEKQIRLRRRNAGLRAAA